MFLELPFSPLMPLLAFSSYHLQTVFHFLCKTELLFLEIMSFKANNINRVVRGHCIQVICFALANIISCR